jgi:hypothetical protein
MHDTYGPRKYRLTWEKSLTQNPAMGNVTWISLVVAFGAPNVFPGIENVYCLINPMPPVSARDPDTIVHNFTLARIELLINTLPKICL